MENKKADSAKKKDSDKTRKELLEELQYVKAENEYLKKTKCLGSGKKGPSAAEKVAVIDHITLHYKRNSRPKGLPHLKQRHKLNIHDDIS